MEVRQWCQFRATGDTQVPSYRVTVLSWAPGFSGTEVVRWRLQTTGTKYRTRSTWRIPWMTDRHGSSSGLRQLWEPSLNEEPGMVPKFSSSWFLEEHTELSVDRWLGAVTITSAGVLLFTESRWRPAFAEKVLKHTCAYMSPLYLAKLTGGTFALLGVGYFSACASRVVQDRWWHPQTQQDAESSCLCVGTQNTTEDCLQNGVT